MKTETMKTTTKSARGVKQVPDVSTKNTNRTVRAKSAKPKQSKDTVKVKKKVKEKRVAADNDIGGWADDIDDVPSNGIDLAELSERIGMSCTYDNGFEEDYDYYDEEYVTPNEVGGSLPPDGSSSGGAEAMTNGKSTVRKPGQHENTSIMKVDPKTTLFFEAIRSGSVPKVKAILRGKNMNLNTRDFNDEMQPTALIAACETDSADIVKLLLTMKKARSIDVNQASKIGRRPMWIAALKANAEVADLLLNTRGSECDVNFTDESSGTSPMYRAILSNSARVVELLIHAKADVNLRRLGYDKKAESPLMKAVQMDNKDIVELLINALCKIQAKSEDGFNALHFAVAYKRYEIAEILLKNEINLHSKSNFGITPMTVAIEHDNPAMVKLLVEYGYKMDKRYKWKETPLSQAINLHSEESAMTLIHHGCSLDKKRGQSYFYMAVDEKLMRLVKYMAAINPMFLQQTWVREKNWPVSIYHRPDIIRWLETESQKVRSLRQLCRGKIFRQLGKYPGHKIKQLKVDDDLRTYISYTSHVKEEFFEQKPLNLTGDCPMDCPAICSRKYCPPIEFSSSSESDDSIDDDEIVPQDKPHTHTHEDEKCCELCS